MIRLTVTADDRQWMKRRLLRSVRCCGLMAILSIAAQFGNVPPAPQAQAEAENAVASVPGQSLDVPAMPIHAPAMPPQTGDTADLSSPHSVPPVGWRRTNRGWERAEDWAWQYGAVAAKDRTLDQWIDHQEQAEPGWIAKPMAWLRGIPPLGIAALQIIAVYLIYRQCPSSVERRSPQRPAA
ncbi:hypothetical protein [Crateriforma conspicua]|uniref:Uncharacterized protein n=1 Tax=Crateriforma conspicua TaxID=2527996 RepID=A0A5C6G163_9PLAN|nr:hypothetical protein [Crateriforma conspicua]TWU67625.1 hypothetical protein V7x_32000 [Crateriforma conspicua]